MAKNEDKVVFRRLIHSYISSIISTTLVLLLVAIAGTLLLNTHRLSNYFKENVKVAVLMKSGVNEKKVMAFEQKLAALPYVKDTRYVSSEQGIAETREAYGDIFISEFEVPPIPDAIEVTLLPQYVHTDSLRVISKEIQMNDIVAEVSYKESIIDMLNANTQRISLFILLFVAALMVISLALISNTVRLNVHANRYNIHTMKLVGATRSFIRRPYVVQGLFQGLISGILAMIILLGVLFYVKVDTKGLFDFFTLSMFLEITALVIGTGIVICTVSSRIVVNKLLELSKEELI